MCVCVFICIKLTANLSPKWPQNAKPKCDVKVESNTVHQMESQSHLYSQSISVIFKYDRSKKKRNNTNNMHAQLYSTNRIPIDFALHILPLAHFESETKSISAKKQLEPKYRKIRPYRCSFRFVATKIQIQVDTQKKYLDLQITWYNQQISHNRSKNDNPIF